MDTFILEWPGGKLSFEGAGEGMSAALLDVDLLQDGRLLGKLKNFSSLNKGRYIIRVRSTGEYGAIGEYKISL